MSSFSVNENSRWVKYVLGTATSKLKHVSFVGNISRALVVQQKTIMHRYMVHSIWYHRFHSHDSLSLSLHPHFNGHFPGEPGLAGVY